MITLDLSTEPLFVTFLAFLEKSDLKKATILVTELASKNSINLNRGNNIDFGIKSAFFLDPKVTVFKSH